MSHQSKQLSDKFFHNNFKSENQDNEGRFMTPSRHQSSSWSASLFVVLLVVFSHGGHSTTGEFDSEVDSTVSSRRGSRRREKHSGINRNEGKSTKQFNSYIQYKPSSSLKLSCTA